ncbi:MAG: class I tRNA ligase family protein, partial [Phycisphaerae bacterium]|nr:class I tRNA ligase family protein [Phycisphaerae bacterium]
VYLSAVKDRLYCQAPNSPRRRATQTVIHQMLMTLVKLYAPILPYTCEEAWDHIPNRPRSQPESVHLALLPESDPDIVRAAEDTGPGRGEQGCRGKVPDSPGWKWGILMYLRTTGLARLEALRNSGVKNPLDAEVVFKVPRGNDADAELIQTHLGELEDMLGVGYARMERVDAVPEGLAVDVEVLDGRDKYRRCARSWKRRPDVGSDAEYPDLSARDVAVMRQLRSG